MSKLDIYKPSDFEKAYAATSYTTLKMPVGIDECAEIANRILNEFIEKNGKVVYGTKGWYPEMSDYDTHHAILICIEPIKKKCTEHIPDVNKTTVLGGYSECSNCGVKLKSEWKEAE